MTGQTRIRWPYLLTCWALMLLLPTGRLRGAPVGNSVNAQHVIVFKEQGRFAGWPANHGIWAWGDEILVGFEVGFLKPTQRGHAIDYSRPAEHVLARSADGGVTWQLEKPAGLRPPPGIRVAGLPVVPGGKAPVPCPGGIRFDTPGFVLTARMADIHVGPSRFYYSLDHGKTWKGPFILPDFGQPGIAARTDYLVDGPLTLTMFLTAAKSNSKEGRVICVRTKDGAATWEFVSFVGPEPPEDDYAIMPASVRLSKREILTMVRHRGWIEAFRSRDNGATWVSEGKVADTGRGNPPSLVRLRDGRLVLVYGYRAAPYGIRARISTDNGTSWSSEITLRDDGGNWDLGYVRTVERADGKLVSVYYFNDDPEGERYIGATIWEAPSH